MPANLSPEYMEAEKRWRKASTPEDKLAALQDMLRTIPKHKGTEKLQADIKRRLAKTREQIEARQRSGTTRRRPDWVVQRQGPGQVAVIGPANSGKSSLVAAVTNAEPDIGEYPFTTVMPLPAMMPYENVQVQLVDLPPLHRDMSPPWLQEVIRVADGILLVFDLSDDDLLALAESAMAYLEEKNLHLRPPEGDWNELIPGCKPGAGKHCYPTLIAANKFEDEEAELRLELLAEMWKEASYPRLPLLRVSAGTGTNLDVLNRCLWHILGKIRVYTRPPGRAPDYSAPFVLDQGCTALDLARDIHKDIGDQFKYARVWGDYTFDAQMVGRDYVLNDGDVLEVHSE